MIVETFSHQPALRQQLEVSTVEHIGRRKKSDYFKLKSDLLEVYGWFREIKGRRLFEVDRHNILNFCQEITK